MKRLSSSTADISIIIAAHNAADFLADQLTALAKQSCDTSWEVVVVDNNSTDNTAQVAASFSDRLSIRIVDAFDGRGAGYARNVGVRSGPGSWIIFCDADDVVGDDWLSTMAKALEEHDYVAGPTELDRLNEPWVANSRGRGFSRAATTFFDIFPYASSCNLGMHRTTFDSIGGFDESFMVGEDLELSLRLWQAGVSLHFEPAALVHYRLRASMSDIFQQSRKYAAVHPLILERLRREGVSVPSRLSRVKVWGWLMKNVPLARTKTGRARWLWTAGAQVGRVQGGLTVRRLYL
jgi:glycosyltransferase involved in cell wall biosynthesis